MTQVLDWQSADRSSIVTRAAEALAAGQVVAFPTETVYGLAANASKPDAVELLYHGKGRAEQKPLTVALGKPEDALDWVPGMSMLGRRLARRCWPGPLTLVFAEGIEGGRASLLAEAVQARVCPQGTVGLRTPAHEAILRVLHNLSEPILLTSANRSGEPAARTAAEVVQAVGESAALVIDGGEAHYGQASTVARVQGNHWEMVRAGAIPDEVLRQLAACVIVFVCTGNTCRSPMAEGLCKKLLAERLGCAIEELPGRGFIVLSAGLAAMMGVAAAEAIEAAHELGADLTGHRSRALSAELLAQADYVIGMTQGHLRLMTAHPSRLGPQLGTLSPTGEDVPDPIGQDQEVYRVCAWSIVRHLESWVAELLR